MESLDDIKIGQNIKLRNNVQGTVKFIGNLNGKSGNYYGIALKQKLGNCNGTIGGTTYFKCKQKYGKFVRRYDIIDPLPAIIFSELCDETLRLVLSVVFNYMDGYTLSSFYNVGNGITRIFFNIDQIYNFSFKRMWKLFVSPHSESDDLKSRYRELNDFYEQKIIHRDYNPRFDKRTDFEFGVFKIINFQFLSTNKIFHVADVYT